jgi:hypothetical protein
MPKRIEPSFELKKIVWDAAAKQGKKINYSAIQRQLDCDLERMRRNPEANLTDDTPDTRTIKRIIEDIDKLPQEVVLTLPKHMWTLRPDYQELKRMSERLAVVSGTEVRRQVEEERRLHRDKLTAVLNTLLLRDLLHVTRMTETQTDAPVYVVMRGEPIDYFPLAQLHSQLEENLARACEEYGDKYVFKCFLPHLKAEYPNVEFKMLSTIVTDDTYQLLEALQAMAHRGTFKGICPMCKDF